MSGLLNEWVDGSLGDDGVLINSQSAAGRSPQPRILLMQSHDSYLRWGPDRRLNGWISAPLTWATKHGFLGQPTGYAAEPNHTFSEILTRRQWRSLACDPHQRTRTQLRGLKLSVCIVPPVAGFLCCQCVDRAVSVVEQVMQTFPSVGSLHVAPVLQHNLFYLSLPLSTSCGVIQQHQAPILPPAGDRSILMDKPINSLVHPF